MKVMMFFVSFLLGGVFTGEIIKARIETENFKLFGMVYQCERVTEHLPGKDQK